MSEPDYMKVLADLWANSGQAMAAAQQSMFKDLSERLGHGLGPGPMFPWAAFLTKDAGVEQAAEEFRKLMLAWKDLPSALPKVGEQPGMEDRVTTELLQKIFDPREWLSATQTLDVTLRHLSEGPQLADLGQLEAQFARLLNAWTKLRTASLEHSTHVLRAWTKAVGEFGTKLAASGGTGRPVSTRSEIVELWVETANRHLLETQRSGPYLETQRKLLRASTEFRLAQRELSDFYGEVFGLPTRSEMDDLTRTVADLRREIRAERRRRQSP